ncbi:MAG TPA: serine/threonine-protein kinase [Kofleriaceae bacterium]|jgi:tetratricopeptide (TPR) repeat protein
MGCPGDDTITLMVSGKLDATRVTALESHLGSCASCRKVVDVLRSRGENVLRENAIGLLSPGTLVGRYRVVDLLGAGGMGVVYAAHDPELDRDVALKLLYPTVSPDGPDESRLRHESKLMAKLRHPNVATIHDLGAYRDQLFLVMELVNGETLRAWVGRDVPWQKVIATFALAGTGLAAAHAAGIVHCDFKPDNVLVDATGRPLITDFGLAHVVANSRASVRDLGDATASSLITVDGGPVFGTPAYMAPQRFDAAHGADAQDDVFAFCVALYEVLYGHRPFAGTTIDELRAAIQTPPKPPSESAVPAWLHAVLVRGLAADRSVRYRTMTELLAALQPTPRRARTRWLAAGLVGIVAIGGAIGWRSSRAPTAIAATCDARAELTGAWDEPAKTRLAAAWSAAPRGAKAWPRVLHALDGYADSWVRASDAECAQPPTSPSVAEFQHRCLHELGVKLHAFSDELADVSTIATAERNVSRLPAIDECGGDAPIPPVPTDPVTRIEVGLLRDELAGASVQVMTGKYAAVRAWTEAIAGRATIVGYKPLIAEVAYRRAQNMLYDPAVKADARMAAKRDAAALAEASGDNWLAAAAWLSLAFDVGEVGLDPVRGHEYLSYARAALERGGGNARIDAQIATQNGRFFWREHKLDDARRELGHALELSKADPTRYINAIDALAKVDDADGQYAKALAEDHQALELRQKLDGEISPQVAATYTNLGNESMQLGHLDDALGYFKKADDTTQRVYGPEHEAVQSTAHGLGTVYLMLGKYDDAERELRRAVRVATAGRGPDDVRTVMSELQLGMVLIHQPDHVAEAVTAIRHSLEVELAKLGPHSAEVATAEGDLGIALRAAGKLDEALAYETKSITDMTAIAGEVNEEVADAYEDKGRVLARLHRARDAAAAFDKAADIYAHTQAPATKLAEARQLAVDAKR